MKNALTLLLLCLHCLSAEAQRNVVLIIADDLGTDYLGFYEDHEDTVAMPHIRALLAKGVRFTRATSNPYCSATRAGILTGRYPFRTGVGAAVGDGSGTLALTEKTIPLLLEAYQPGGIATANIGKWHLHHAVPTSNYNYPNTLGYDHYAGLFTGALPDYYNWTKVTNGTASTVTTYATTETANDAIAWTAAQTNPFFLWLAFNAPHTPFHLPPVGLHSHTGLSGTQQDINQNPIPYFKASVEALDHEIGRLFDSLEANGQLDSTDIIFIGDNGDSPLTAQNSNTAHAKGSIYHHGTHVPMIIAGPSVVNPGRVSDALVNTTDLFATILELFGYEKWGTQITHASPVDCRSLLPIVKNQDTTVRPWAFTETFQSPATDHDGKAMHNLSYKLMRFDDGHEEFYHLPSDPEEASNLLNGYMSAEAKANYAYLSNEMTQLPAQHNPVVTAWLRNTTGLTGKHYVAGNSTPIIDAYSANVQAVKYNATNAFATATGIPAYIIGPYLDGNPSQGTPQTGSFRFPLNPAQNTGTLSPTTGGNIGAFINGAALFDFRDGASYSSSTGQNQGGPIGGTGDGVWNRDAVVAEMNGFDCNKGHPANGNYHHHQNPSAFNLDLNVLSNVCDLYLADGLYMVDSTQHSPLLGFAYDGFPIYGAYAYKERNGTGSIVRMKSGYRLRNITVRTHYANGQDVTDGPPVSAAFPLGMYREDYEHIASDAPDSLDVHNGRYCKTPEYPNGTYCYFATVDPEWNSAYPYAVGPNFYGVKNAAKVTTIPGTPTTYNGAVLNAVAAPTDVSCLGANDGEIHLFVNGGNPPYTYNWGAGVTTKDRSGLAPGTYTVTVTDGIAQTVTESATIAQPASLLSASATVTDADCFGYATGNIALNVTGGWSGYSFLWNDGNTSQNRSSLPAGNYAVTVSDLKDCNVSLSASVGQPSGDLTVIQIYTCIPAEAGISTDTLTNLEGCDSFIVTVATLIPSNLLVENAALPGGIYRSQGDLTSYNTAIATGLDVQFISDTGVKLEHDFDVALGAVFEARIEACPPAGNPMGSPAIGKKTTYKKSLKGKLIQGRISLNNGRRVTFSNSKQKASPGNIRLKVIPVPDADLVILQSELILQNNLYLHLVNDAGETVIQKEFPQGSTLCHLDVQTLYDGNYALIVTDGKEEKRYAVPLRR